MRFLLGFCSAIDTLNKNLGKIFACILLPMILLATFEVFSRYVLNSPTVWAWELVVQIWGLMLMACGGYCYWKGGFVRVDIIYQKFPEKIKDLILIITNVLALICMALIFYFGWKMFYVSFMRNERISSVWGSPMWTIRGWVPLGSGLMFLQVLSSLIRSVLAFLGLASMDAGADEIAEAIASVRSTERLPDEEDAK